MEEEKKREANKTAKKQSNKTPKKEMKQAENQPNLPTLVRKLNTTDCVFSLTCLSIYCQYCPWC